jgi:hypothetical protein
VVRFGMELSNKKILVPTSILQVRETSRCSHRRTWYGRTWELNRILLGIMDLDLVSIILEV